MSFERAGRVADAVLLEGYVLYPYRPDSAKNRYRWTFGVLAPQAWSEVDGSEPWWLEAQLLVARTSPEPILRGRLRFLSVVDRRVEAFDGTSFVPTPRLEVDGRPFVSWEEGELREIDFAVRTDVDLPFSVDASTRIEILRDAEGSVRGRIVRTQAELSGMVRMRAEAFNGALARIAIRVENLTPAPRVDAPRAEIMRLSCTSTHLLVGADGARFLSLLDPPPEAHVAATRCNSVGCWPVLAGADGEDDLVLASPIILYDHPKIAPESTGDFYDACEIDELLALRTRTLTPEERELARATDARAAAVVDRALAMTDEEMARLHGAIRDRPAFAPGTRVRLRLDPKKRRTDAQDLLYTGRSATVRAVKRDVDGREYLCVTIDDDPASDMMLARGILRHYYPDEVEPL